MAGERRLPPPQTTGLASLPTDAISYEDLYARWERGNWRATELDFTEDARQWREDFTEFERQAAIWNYCLFFWGEDAVADNLSPYIDAAPLEEQKYFLATQQVDEARHAVFFKRFMQEVCGIGDGTMASGLQAIRPQLTPGLPQDLRPPRHDGRRAAQRPLAGEARGGRDALPRRDRGVARAAGPALHLQLPRGTRPAPRLPRGMENIAADEQRHIGFGVKLLADLNREDPVGRARGRRRACSATSRATPPRC